LETRPVGGFILSLLGGIFILLGTIMGVAFAPTCGYLYCYIPPYYYPFLLASAVCGVAVLIAGGLVYRHPDQHVVWGVVVLVLAATSAVGVITGYFAIFGAAGLVLGIVGGAITISWRPGGAGGALPAGAVRLCPACGRFVPLVHPFCPLCGAPAPSLRGPPATWAAEPGQPPRP
jgi:hypothetical protein